MNEHEMRIYKDNMAFNDALDTIDSLSHYGRPGMKWGVWNDETRRKYMGGNRGRNGSVTRENRRQGIVDRFRIRMNRRKASARKPPSNVSASGKKLADPNDKSPEANLTETMEQKPKSSGGHRIREVNPKTLSDEDLRAANQRLQDEITYKQRQAQLKNLNMSKGERRRKAVNKKAVEIGTNVISNFATKKLTQYLDSLTKGGPKPKITAAKVKNTVEKSTKPAFDKIISSIDSVSFDTPVSSYMYTTLDESKPSTYTYTPKDEKKDSK